jgi:hypothetical protein
MFWSNDKKPDPDAFVDRKGYYAILRVGEIELYQSWFRKMLAAIKKNNYIGSSISNEQLIKAKEVAEQAAKEDKLVVDYLLVMLMQFIYADEFDREDGQCWVRIITGIDRRFADDKYSFFPPAELAKARLNDAMNYIKD